MSSPRILGSREGRLPPLLSHSCAGVTAFLTAVFLLSSKRGTLRNEVVQIRNNFYLSELRPQSVSVWENARRWRMNLL